MCCWVFQCSLCLMFWEQIPTGQTWILAQLEATPDICCGLCSGWRFISFVFEDAEENQEEDPGNLTIRKEGAEPSGEDVGVITEDAELLHDLGNTADAATVWPCLLDWSFPTELKYLRFYRELWRKRSLDKSSGGKNQLNGSTHWAADGFETMSGCLTDFPLVHVRFSFHVGQGRGKK